MLPPDFTIIELDRIDSTNNYAMQMIDANNAHHGLTIVATSQWAGKGQRGNVWTDVPEESLLMSLIVQPEQEIAGQFQFNAAVAVGIANVLRKLYTHWDIRIKWPNDIIINDKKAGGILIENVLRGSKWTHCVIGLGLNVLQQQFPENMPLATSLKIASGISFKMTELRDAVRQGILDAVKDLRVGEKSMDRYNDLLYKGGRKQGFSDGSGKWEVTILNAQNDGSLLVQKENGEIVSYRHGQVMWEW